MGESAKSLIVVLVTCPTQRHATQLASKLVGERVAACVNILPRVQSLFWWHGRVDHASESLLLIKTTARQFAPLRRTVRAHHPYDVPEIIALPITRAHQPYVAWMLDSLISKNKCRRP